MPEKDLAEIYGIETKVLKQAVKRNIKRFPGDFMFVLIKHDLNEHKTIQDTRGSVHIVGPRATVEEEGLPTVLLLQKAGRRESAGINRHRAEGESPSNERRS